MKTIEIIKDEVAKEKGIGKWYFKSDTMYWPEVCKRYAIEVAKASLESAKNNFQLQCEYCGYESKEYLKITDEQNIVL